MRHAATDVWRLRRNGVATAAPDTVDLRLVGTCQLRCEWCWGPEHFRRGSIDEETWAVTLDELAQRGTRQVIISGGEPTRSPLLGPVVKAARDSGLAVTLSTNGIYLGQFKDVVALVQDVGIPVDGATPEMNERMRKGSLRFRGWERAIAAIRLVQEMRETGLTTARVTVRVVVARPNLQDVANIPDVLGAAGVDLNDVRVKLYQVEPFGPHFRRTDFDASWAVSSDDACACATETRARARGAHVELQLYGNTVGRYFLIDPDGWATGTDEDDEGRPVEVEYGDVVNSLEGTLAEYHAHRQRLGCGSDTAGEPMLTRPRNAP